MTAILSGHLIGSEVRWISLILLGASVREDAWNLIVYHRGADLSLGFEARENAFQCFYCFSFI